MADLTQLRPCREGLWGGAKSDVEPPFQYYAAAVTSIQVKNVPSDVHQTLRRRASALVQALAERMACPRRNCKCVASATVLWEVL